MRISFFWTTISFSILISLSIILACGGPYLSPPPVQVGGVDVEYESGELEGPAVAGAVWRDGETPTIILEDITTLPPAVQWMKWAHEICHLKGHDLETGADCCAGATFSRIEITPWDSSLWLQEHSWTGPKHPAGAIRAAVFLTCYSLE